MRKSYSEHKLASFTRRRFFASRKLPLAALAGAVVLLAVRALLGHRPSCEIPKIIHQTWKTVMVTRMSAERIKTWVDHNPGWRYMFWTNKQGREFMKKHFPEHLPMYDGYKQVR